MALFGNRSRNIPREWWERGQDDAIGAMGTTMPMPPQMPDEMPQRAPGFWQGGDKFRARDGIAGLLAVVGDALSRRGGGEGGAVDMLAGTRMSAMEQAQLAQAAQAKRIQELQDYEAKKQVDQRYLPPVNQQRVAEYFERVKGPEARDQYLENQINPPVWRQGSDGQFYRVETTAPPQFTDEDWANGQPVGGGGGNATGNFPGRYR